MEEILVYKATLDGSQSVKSISEMRKENAALKKELEDSGKVGSDAYNKIATQAAATGKTFEEVEKSMRDGFVANKQKIDDFNRSLRQTSDGVGSINELRQGVISLANQYDKLSKAERDSAKGTELRDKLHSTTEELKKLEAETGRNQRNVGNYAAGYIEAAKEVELFGIKVSTIVDPLKKAQSSFKDAEGGVNGFLSAFGAGAIGIIISGIQLLINIFQEFGGVADKVEQITEGLSGGFKAFVTGGSAIEAGKAIADLTEKIQLMEEAEARAILTNEQTSAAIKRLQVSARDRTKTEEERIGILKKADDLAYKQWEGNYDRILQTALAEEARFAKKNTLTDLEVKTAIFSNDVIKKSYDYLTDAQIDKTRDKVGAVVKLDGEEVKKLIENRVKLEQASEAYTDIVDKNAVRENKLADDAQVKKDKAATDEKTRQANLEKERAAYLSNLSKLEADFYLSEREKVEKSFNDKIATLKGNGTREQQLRLTIAQERELALQKFDDDAIKKRAAKVLADRSDAFTAESQFITKQLQIDLDAEELTTATKEEHEKRRQEIKIASFQKQLALVKAFAGADGVITKEELQGIQAIENALAKAQQPVTQPKDKPITFGQSLGLDQKAIDEAAIGVQTMQSAFNAIGQVANQAFQVRLSNLEDEKNAEIAAVEASGLSQDAKQKKISQINKKTAKEQYEIQVQQFKVNQAVQIVQAIANTAAAIIAQFANPTPYAGAVLAAIAAATGAAQIAIIASQKPPAPPKFARGGQLEGPSHAQGGIKTNVGEFEGGELVATKRAGFNQKSRSVIGHINKMFGGVGYPGSINLPNNLQNAIEAYIGNTDRTLVPSDYMKFAAGGFVPIFPQTTTDRISGSNAMVEEFRSLKEAILNQPQPVVSVVDINQGQAKVKVIENAGTNS